MKSTSRRTNSLAAWLCLGLLAVAGCGSSGSSIVAPERCDGSAGREPSAAGVEPPERHYHAARAAILEDDVDKASLEVKLALQENPLDAESHFLHGCLLERKGENDQAIVGFQRALALDPANPAALYNLGTMLLQRGEAFPACRLLENAVLARPGHVPSYNNLAKAYFQVGLPELSLAAYEEALRRDSVNTIAIENLARLTESAGLHDTAATYRRRLEALRLDPAARPPVDPTAPKAQAPSQPADASAAGVEQQPAAAPATAIPAQAGDAGNDPEADALRALLLELPHVKVERRAGRLTLTGWTRGPKERAMLDRILGKPSGLPKENAPGPEGKPSGLPKKSAPAPEAAPSEVLDLTSDDTGDPDRMIEIDTIIFIMYGLDQRKVGFNFLDAINFNFNYFASNNQHQGTGYTAPPDLTGVVNGLSQQGWIFAASVDYVVNIANASDERVAVLARPHLTALSGSPAKFLTGGELVFKVSGINSGDIKPYPFGTTLMVTPTLLRTPAEDGTPRVHLGIETGRLSILSILEQDPDKPVAFEKISVTSEAVITLNQTLILSGLSQRESRTGNSGVPILRDIPLLKFFFSTRTTTQSDAAVIILLTPRDAAFFDARNQKALEEFVEMRRAFIRAKNGAPEDMQRFRERYPDAKKIAPNRFASHFFLMENSELYRAASGQDLSAEDLELDLLGPGSSRLRPP
jgi:tetratricopeptide (TPR) repeat protein